MIERLNNFFKRIFNNDETIVFSFLILSLLLILYYFGSIVTPFLVSIIVAYLLVGLQKKLESFGLKSFWALLVTYIIFIVVSVGLLMWLLPIVYNQIISLVANTPAVLERFSEFVAMVPSTFPDALSSDPVSKFFNNFVEELQDYEISEDVEISSIVTGVVASSISGIQSFITTLIYILLFPILVYFFLFDRHEILNGFLKIIPGERKMLDKIWKEMDVQLSNYVKGKTLEIFVVGVSAAIIFSIVGLEYTALLSVLVGLSVIIPYIGAFAVTIPIVIIGLFQFGLTFDFWLLMVLYLILQILDGNLLVPIIFSDAVKLHPVIIILAVFVFGNMFGLWGIFLAIPIATFIKAVWNAWPSEKPVT